MAPRNRNSNARSASSEADYTRADLEREFPNDAVCLDWLWRQNLSDDGEHAECPKCDRERRFHRVASRPSYSCDTCGHHLHPTAGTIFEKSSTGLDLWFKAVFLMTATRTGCSAKHLERELGVTYKTAWRMMNLIRNELMDQDDDQLSGEVEMDETYVGGKPRLKDRVRNPDGSIKKGPSTKKRKATVFGAVERGGRVRAEVIPQGEQPNLAQRASTFVLPESTVFTDEYPAYLRLNNRFARHHRIQHKANVYVRGNVHTQTIEGFWAMVKTGLIGTYHGVSEKWLQGYLNEYAWRYNHRDDREPMFKTLLRLAAAS
ncbi:MAG: IS1595 family transposase [Acidimicrobiia bacterium]